MKRPLWFKGFFWKKIIEIKSNNNSIIFKEDGSIHYLNYEIKIWLCKLIAEIIFSSKYSENFPKISIFLSNFTKKNYRSNLDFVSSLETSNQGKVDSSLQEKGIPNIFIWVDSLWKDTIDELKKGGVNIENDINTFFTKNESIINSIVRSILNETVVHELFHNFQHQKALKVRELQRYGKKLTKAIGKFGETWFDFLLYFKRANFSLAYIYLRTAILEIADDVKIEGEAEFFSSTDRYKLNKDAVLSEYRFARRSAEELQSGIDSLFDSIQRLLDGIHNDLKQRSPYISQDEKKQLVEIYFLKNFNFKEIEKIKDSIHTEVYTIGPSIVQCILFFLEEQDFEKIVKMNTVEFLEAYNIACEELNLLPFVSYNKKAIFNVSKNLRRLADIKKSIKKLS